MTAKKSTAAAKRDRAAYLKEWRAANVEKRKAYNARHYRENLEARRAWGAANYRKNAESYKARAAKWAKANRERRQAITDKWRAEHPEIYAAARRRDWVKNKPKRQALSRDYRKRKPEFIRSLRVAWRSQHPGDNAHRVGLRRTRKMQATPPWADLKAIKAIYARAAALKKATGEDWHVDHEIPLQHPLVCGLHVPANLRVIRAAVNLSKGNRLSA
jgi:hypothetical protein